MNVVLFCIFCIFVLFFCFLISSLYCIMLICCLCSFWKCGAEDRWPTCCRPNLLIGTNNKTWAWTASMSADVHVYWLKHLFKNRKTFLMFWNKGLTSSPFLFLFLCALSLCIFLFHVSAFNSPTVVASDGNHPSTRFPAAEVHAKSSLSPLFSLHTRLLVTFSEQCAIFTTSI